MRVNFICFLKDFFSFYNNEVASPGIVVVKSWGESCNMQSRKQTHQKFYFYFWESLLRSKIFFTIDREINDVYLQKM